MHQFEGYRVVDMDDIFDCGHQHVAPVAEQADAALADRELLKVELQTNVPEYYAKFYFTIIAFTLLYIY